MSETCRDFEEMLSPYLDGELVPDAKRRVEAHLAGCPACRARLESWRESDAALAGLAPARTEAQWEALAQRVDRAIDAEEAWEARLAETALAAGGARPRSAPSRWWLWSSGAAAAAVLVLLMRPWIDEPPADGNRSTAAEAPVPADVDSPRSLDLPLPKERANASAPIEGAPAESAPAAPAQPELAPPGSAPTEAQNRNTAGAIPDSHKREGTLGSVSLPQVEEDKHPAENELREGLASEAAQSDVVDTRKAAEKPPAATVPEAAGRSSGADVQTMRAPIPESEASGSLKSKGAFSQSPPTALRMDSIMKKGITPAEDEQTLESHLAAIDVVLADSTSKDSRPALLLQRLHVVSGLVAWNRDRWCRSALAALEDWKREGLPDSTATADSTSIEEACRP